MQRHHFRARNIQWHWTVIYYSRPFRCMPVRKAVLDCLLGRPEPPFRTGLCFTRDVSSSLFLFRHSFSELPRPIALKLCHVVGIRLNFIITLQKLGGAPPPPPQKKNWGAKNMQNFGQFWTTSDFDREYLRNGWRYLKSEKSTNYGNSSCV